MTSSVCLDGLPLRGASATIASLICRGRSDGSNPRRIARAKMMLTSRGESPVTKAVSAVDVPYAFNVNTIALVAISVCISISGDELAVEG